MNIDIMIYVEPFAFRKCVFGILSGESRHKMAYIAEEKIKDPAEKALVEEIRKSAICITGSISGRRSGPWI